MQQERRQARISPYEDMSLRSSAWWTDDGIYMGYEIEPPEDAAHLLRGEWKSSGKIKGYRGDRHILTVGPNGSGKSRRLLIPNLYHLKNWTICAIDPKGELFAASAVHRSRGNNHRIALLDPFGVVKKTYPELAKREPKLCESVGYNPIAALDPTSERFVDDAKALAVALIKTDNSKDKYWSQAAQALIKGLVMGLRLEAKAAQEEMQAAIAEYRAETGKEPDTFPIPKTANPSLQTLREKIGLTPKKLAAYCAELVQRYEKTAPALAATLGEFVEHSSDDKEMGGIRRTAKVQTDWLDSEAMGADLGKGAYDWASIKQTPTTIYLVLPPEYLATHGTWLRLMVTSILRPLLRSVDDAGKPPVPVLFMLDEFAQLGKMEIIEDNYALMRGFGVKLWTVFQDLNQAKALYEERWESFISNAGITQSFAPQDMTTRKYLSELGDTVLTWHDVESFSASGGVAVKSMSSSQSISKANVQEPLMYPHELGKMRQGQAVVFTQRGTVERRYFPDATHPENSGVNDMMAEAQKLQKP